MSTATLNTLQLIRRFKASRDRVFNAFSSFAMLQRWLGPGECAVVGGQADFRTGGSYRIEMKTTGGCNSDASGIAVVGGVYREVKPPERIVFTWAWLNDEEAPETVVTVELADLGSETLMTFTHSGFASEESRDNHEHGWSGSFEKLEALLAS